MAELVDAARRSLRRLGADAEVDARVEPSLPLLADRERIERALTAMVLRARPLGPVRIDARRSGGHAEVRVEWSGDALVDPEHALDPRWEAPTSQRQGFGMALTVARIAAELHGGSLSAASTLSSCSSPSAPGCRGVPAAAKAASWWSTTTSRSRG